MKSKEEIKQEIMRRVRFKNSESYGSYRANRTFMRALLWVLETDQTAFFTNNPLDWERDEYFLKKLIDI